MTDTPDHEPIQVGNIGNYYGGLWLQRENGKDFWAIADESYNFWWHECPRAVATAIRAALPDLEKGVYRAWPYWLPDPPQWSPYASAGEDEPQ